MRTRFITLDNAGKAKRVGEGVAFALMPGRAADAPNTQRLGAYPARVRTSDGDVLEVTGPHVYRFGRHVSLEIDRSKVEGAGKESWCVVTFDNESERFEASARPTTGTILRDDAPAGGSPSGKQGVLVGAASSVDVLAHSDYGGSNLNVWVRVADVWWLLDSWTVGGPEYLRSYALPAGTERFEVRDADGIAMPVVLTARE